MNLVLLSLFEDEDVTLDFSKGYVLDFEVAGKLLNKIPEFGAELESGVLNYPNPLIVNELYQSAHLYGLG